MDNTKIIGEKIRALRESRQISVEDLMERTGLAPEQIGNLFLAGGLLHTH